MIVLDAKTDFSFLRGFGTPKQWLARCKDIGVTAFGVADYCSTWGHAGFRKTFAKSGIKLLYGVQLPVVHRLERDPRHSLVTLIAKKSMKPLYDLTRLAHEQMYFRPRLMWEQLEGFEGWVIVNDINPLHARLISKYDQQWFAGISHDYENDLTAWRGVHCYGPRFPKAEDREAFALFQKIAGDSKIGEFEFKPVHLLRAGERRAMMPEADDAWIEHIVAETDADLKQGSMISIFKPAKKGQTKIEQLRATAMIRACDVSISLAGMSQGESAPSFFDQKYQARLDRELKVIEEKKFEDYFFFVGDLVRWARRRMLVGPGRGSSGGSLLCYLLGITTVDPLVHGTLFERFIDITRPDWPDIDIDFPDTRREEIFEYLKDKYGADRFARLGTLSEFAAKSAFNDTAKALNIPKEVGYALGKFTEGSVQGQSFGPDRVMGLGPWEGKGMADEDHMKLVEQHPKIKMAASLCWQNGTSVDGHVRHHGVHAAGLIVTQDPVSAYGTINAQGVIEMEMKGAEDNGLLKMDALGLRTLSVLTDACELAKVDPNSLFTLNWSDPKVYDVVFKKDRVTGIFQFEGHAVRSLMKGARCETFEDICALTSLARPGPLIGGAAENWAKCRIGQQEARDLHPALESTYGVICYQEQAMHIVRDLAGFTEPEVNGFRRAVGKKEVDKLKGFGEKFINGATNFFGEKLALAGSGADNGAEHNAAAKEQAEALWDELCEFGSYAFNRAHAVEYAMISYMCAWLKTYHPLAFAAACLKHVADDEQGKNLLRELADEGYEYVPFDVAKSQATWAIMDGKLYGGFDSVKGIGSKTAEKLLALRQEDPENWLEGLTEAQRTRLTKDMNTPWHDLTYFSKTYKVLYEKPDAWRQEGVKAGFRGPVLRIKDIPSQKGNFAFIGRIMRKQQKDANDAAKVATRGGRKYNTNTTFWNLFIEDDTGEIGCTINRFKADDFRWLTESDTDGRDFFIRGNIINANADGRRWIFIDNIVELKHVA